MHASKISSSSRDVLNMKEEKEESDNRCHGAGAAGMNRNHIRLHASISFSFLPPIDENKMRRVGEAAGGCSITQDSKVKAMSLRLFCRCSPRDVSAPPPFSVFPVRHSASPPSSNAPHLVRLG